MESKELTAAQALCAFAFSVIIFLLASMLCTIEQASY